MAKTIAQKLMLKPGHRLAIPNAPAGVLDAMGDLPDGAAIVAANAKTVDAALVFVSTFAEFEAAMTKWKPRLAPAGMLWLAYPKGPAGKAAGIHRDIIRETSHTHGLDTVAQFALDDIWSAIRLKVV